MRHSRRYRRSVLVATLCAACTSQAPQSGGAPQPKGLASQTQIIPTRYFADRFFATPVTPAGDTVTFFLDTGGGSVAWESSLNRFGPVDSVKTSRGYRHVVPLPAFRSDRSLPTTTAASLQGQQLIVYPATDPFGQMIAKHSQGQLGQLWFDEHVWTFDYPRHRLLLHSTSVPASAGARTTTLTFRTDSTGKRLDHDPRVSVIVDGDTLQLLFDTGATVWLTDDALAQLRDGLPAERAISHVRQSILNRWHAKHPEWLFLPKADQVAHADLIKVPSIRIAGFDVGPVWFDGLPEPPTPPSAPVTVHGTLGGSALKYFVTTVDYPRGVATFEKAQDRVGR